MLVALWRLLMVTLNLAVWNKIAAFENVVKTSLLPSALKRPDRSKECYLSAVCSRCSAGHLYYFKNKTASDLQHEEVGILVLL